MLRLVRSSLWGTHEDMKGQMLDHDSCVQLTTMAAQQAVLGLVAQGLIDAGIHLEREDALTLFASLRRIRNRNQVMDEAVASFCKEMSGAGIRLLVMKGQTLAALYPDVELRQSGDIDFLVHSEDWDRAMQFVHAVWQKDVKDTNSEKHVEWQKDGVQYEMHRWLTAFAYPKHHRYWEQIIVPEIWQHPNSVNIGGYEVPTLAPTYNVLYTFVHIFYHLILDGIGLRQFCDWAVLMAQVKSGNINSSKSNEAFDAEILKKHLKGIGLLDAFTGLGALLTDYLGLPEDDFPFSLSEKDHQQVPVLFENMLEMGNFGHNLHYKNKPGIWHGVEHIGRISRQARTFYHYAPAEVWWRIPNMFKWWGVKLWRMAGANKEQ